VKTLRALLRSVPLVLLILAGVLLAALIMPWQTEARRQSLIQGWSRLLLAIFGVKPIINGHSPEKQPLLMICNHVSWLDVFLIQSALPVRFVSKAEVRNWPIFGWLSDQTGTIFLERQSRRQTAVIGAQMAQALKQGHSLCFFPEGTTTAGRQLLPFKSSMFQCALDTQTPVLPLLLDYRLGNGEANSAIPFVGEMTFIASLWNVLSAPKSEAQLWVGATLIPESTRYELRDQAQQAATKLLAGL
jgi:1-acyl-sn-glycerol-3-phosphate acyltransferase